MLPGRGAIFLILWGATINSAPSSDVEYHATSFYRNWRYALLLAMSTKHSAKHGLVSVVSHLYAEVSRADVCGYHHEGNHMSKISKQT